MYFEKHFRAEWELTDKIDGNDCYSYFLLRECKEEVGTKHIRDLKLHYYSDSDWSCEDLGSLELKLMYS